MPHSSGGGSHGGGYHSSGSSRSSSSRSSSRSSGSYNDNLDYTYKHSSVALNKYVYYDRRGRYHSVLSSSRPQKPDLFTAVMAIIVVSIFAGLLIWFFLDISFFNPSKLDLSSYVSVTKVEDHVNLGNNSKLKESMKNFKEITGVTPCVEFVNDFEWLGHYKDLETFALSEYLRMFDDEKHWLFVISIPSDYKDSDFVNWRWEGMIGDLCYPAVNSSSEDNFTEIIHKYLLRSTPEEMPDNLALAFDEYSDIVMDLQFEIAFAVVAAIIFIIYIALVIYYIRDYVIGNKLYNAAKVPSNAPEVECKYCGRIYIKGSIFECPSCGAPTTKL